MRNYFSAIAGVAACLLSVGFSATATAQTPAEPAKPAAASDGGYYIDFRVAQIGAYGHSYVAYGRLNGNGKPASAQYADLHPRGNYAVMALGHVLPVPANTVWDPDVLKLPVASSYRRRLSASDYQKLLAAIKRANANKNPYWNAISNNCNHYVAELARAIGLKAPNDFQVSYAFIPALRAMNEGTQSETRPEAKRKPAPAGARAPAATDQTPRS